MSSREYISFIQMNHIKARPVTPFNTPIFTSIKSIHTPFDIFNEKIQTKDGSSKELNDGWLRTLNVLKRDNIISEKELNILAEDSEEE
jgi:hypothetical protein